MDLDVSFLAGTISSVIFASSVLPMVAKALRTRDLTSYSLGNLLLANVGNLVHTVYILSLPAGPIWVLHGFYLLTTGLMLVLYLTHSGLRRPSPVNPVHPVAPAHPVGLPDPAGVRLRPGVLRVVPSRAA